MEQKRVVVEKLNEAVAAVVPIASIVFTLCLFFVPIKSGLVLSFLIGTVLIVVGMALFTIGADSAMTQMGSHIGAKLTASRKLWFILAMSFLLGVIITMAEPDLQVLATYVPAINAGVLIATVSVGVGFFLLVSMLRIILGAALRWFLLAFYGVVFLLATRSAPDFLSVAFDSGGVTTGPMTVPFIIALGVGVSSIRSDERSKTDTFGLIALCSIGPILAVLILGFIYSSDTSEAAAMLVGEFVTSVEVGTEYLHAIPHCMKEVIMALLPIVAFFLFFQVFSLKLKKRLLLTILIGVAFTYAGLVLFLTGVNVGFSSLGYVLGGALIEHGLTWLIIPLAMLMGWFIIGAEPAVHVLTKQVSELSAGAISEKAMARTLSIAVSAANGLAMLRVLTGIPILRFMAVGYGIALLLTFFVPPTYTAIAFDAGGVASGPMTAAFMLPFAMGATSAVGGNIMTDAFGLVSMVALMPLITVQIMGAVAQIRSRRAAIGRALESLGEEEVIELWEVA